MARANSAKNGLEASGRTRPSVLVRPIRRDRASPSGLYPSSLTASRTRFRVSLATGRGPSLSTYETTPGGNAGAPGDVVPGHRHGLLLSADVVRQRISRRLTTVSGSTAVQPSIQRLFGQGVGVRLHV